jgi:hypothetical protein
MTVSVTNVFVDSSPANATDINKNFVDLVNITSDGTRNINIMSAAVGSALVSGDIYTEAFTDYSATTTISNLISITKKYIYYKKVGKSIFVYAYLSGTIQSTGLDVGFTLPYPLSNSPMFSVAAPTVPSKAIINGSCSMVYSGFIPGNPSYFLFWSGLGTTYFSVGNVVTLQTSFFYEST